MVSTTIEIVVIVGMIMKLTMLPAAVALSDHVGVVENRRWRQIGADTAIFDIVRIMTSNHSRLIILCSYDDYAAMPNCLLKAVTW